MSGSILHISVQELCEQAGIGEQAVRAMVEHGIAMPIAGDVVTDWVFDTRSAQWLQKATRLQQDFDLEWVAIAMVIDLLRQRDALLLENRQLRQRLQRFLDNEE